RLLRAHGLLGLPQALEVGVEIAGERDRRLLDEVLLVAFHDLQLPFTERPGQRDVGGVDRHRPARERLDRVEPHDLHVPQRGLAGLDVDLAIRALPHRAAEVLGAEPGRNVVEDGPRHRLVGPLHLEGVALEQAGEVEALLGEHVPLADVAVDRPDAADGRGQNRVADEPEG
ncbi:MAG: hypothetical protein ACK56I_10140, partial [bacterium]